MTTDTTSMGARKGSIAGKRRKATTCVLLGLVAGALSCANVAAQADVHRYRVMHYFNGVDGSAPYGGLVSASDGTLYGTTFNGGAFNAGTFFSITPDGRFHLLASFSMAQGAAPYGGLAVGKNGDLYGTAMYGGANGTGTFFRATPSGKLTALYSFSRPDHHYKNADGANPAARLTLGLDGHWYGSTPFGGANNAGTLFKITSGGSMTVLHSFSAFSTISTINSDGAHPISALTLAGDGNFYGVTEYGGNNGSGTVFRMTPDGVVTTLHNFAHGATGAYPMAALTLSGGLLYGTASTEGANDTGIIYSIDPVTGQFQVVYSFPKVSPGSSANAGGLFPTGDLFAAPDGSLYGTTVRGGKNGFGTVFRMKPSSAPVTLFNFSAGTSSNGAPGTNYSGSAPFSGLVGDPSGKMLFGMSSTGGRNNVGVVFSVTQQAPGTAPNP